VDKKSAARAALFSRLFYLEILQHICQRQDDEGSNQKNNTDGESNQTSQEGDELEEDAKNK